MPVQIQTGCLAWAQCESRHCSWKLSLPLSISSLPSDRPTIVSLPVSCLQSRARGSAGGEKERRQRQELTPKPFSDLLFQACPLERERRLVSDASWMKTDLKSVRRDTYCIGRGRARKTRRLFSRRSCFPPRIPKTRAAG